MENIINLVREAEKDGTIRKASDFIKSSMDSKSFLPLTDRKIVEQLMNESRELRRIFGYIFELSGREYFGEVPDTNEFEILEISYVGADGKSRKTLPKYMPKHIAPKFYDMQLSYKQYLGENLDKKYNERPGLILLSAYRSPYYQTGIFVRKIAENGIDFALKSTMLPGMSQHSDYHNCAIDITNIGDMNGKIEKENKTSINFEETIEYKWLLENANKFNFYQSYPRNNKLGVIFEPWHWQSRFVSY